MHSGFASAPPSGRSPFPPIADYAFLSDCEIQLPDRAQRCGRVDVRAAAGLAERLQRAAGPRARAPSGIGPYDEVVPAARRYLPGSLMLETTWQTRTGWLIVRDALCMGPWHNVDERSRTHRRSPTDFDAEHCLLRTVQCVSGSVDLSMTCEPVFDYGRRRADVGVRRAPATARSSATAEGSMSRCALTTDLRPGIEGAGLHARTRMVEGDSHFVALSWSPLPPPRTLEEAEERLRRTQEYWRQWITARRLPRPPVAQLPAAQRADPQGPDLRADRRAARGGHDLAAGDPARRAQLGLPLRLGARLDVRPVGPVHPRASTARPTTSSTSSPTPAATATTCR